MASEKTESLWVTFRTKVVPSLLTVCIISLATASLSIAHKASKVLDLIEAHDARLTALEKDLIIVKSQMVGWDTLKRIELTLSTLATAGRSGEAMRSMSNAIRNELDARRENPTNGGR